MTLEPQSALTTLQTVLGVAATGLLIFTAGLVLFALTTARRAERLAPADGRFVVIDGVKLHYVDEGVGPAVLMIHGLGGQLRNFRYAILAPLRAHHRVVLLDRPGSGYSGEGPQADLTTQADLIAKFIEALHLDRPAVVGHSLGGAIALVLALERPDLVRGLALVAPLTQLTSDRPAAFKSLGIASPLVRNAVAWTLATPVGLLTERKRLTALFRPEEVLEDFMVDGGGVLGARPRAFIAASADYVAIDDALPRVIARYSNLAVPVRILFGRGDNILDPKLHGGGLAAAGPDVRLTVIEGGHMLPVTQPTAVSRWIGAAVAEMGPAPKPATPSV